MSGKAAAVAIRRWRGEPLASLAGQSLIAGVFFLPLLARLHEAILADDIFIRPGQSDAYNFLWGYWWVQKAASLGTSPLHCSWVLPPNGADLRLHTLALLPALISYPLGRVLGTVAAYNLTVLGLLVGGALAAQWTFRRALGLSPPAAFAAGALFGFSPYFVYKAHAQLHLVGAAFWAGALGQIATAYARHDFGWRRGVLLALFVWATFWSSLAEWHRRPAGPHGSTECGSCCLSCPGRSPSCPCCAAGRSTSRWPCTTGSACATSCASRPCPRCRRRVSRSCPSSEACTCRWRWRSPPRWACCWPGAAGGICSRSPPRRAWRGC
ncbi:MAG: hypothetical protein DMF83_23140 [Acidobacteria bacterium]|nr:MAG: hypothetical protein DMF83_23140 [Acidobacteriota bacterium]